MRRFSVSADGISLVELLVAVAILSVISVATIKLIGTTDKELLQSQGERKSQQTDEAIASFIYDDFQTGNLGQSANPAPYINALMPEDLQRGPGLTIVSLLGNDSRYDDVAPKCRLLADTSTTSPTFQFAADCALRGGKSIGLLMNEMIALGVKITLAIEGAATHCTISTAVAIANTTKVATATVDDPACLVTADNPATPISAGSHVLLPRFMVHNPENPAAFHISLIEPPGKNAPAIALDAPSTKAVIGGGFRNDIPIIDALATIPLTQVSVAVEAKEPNSRLGLKTVPPGVTANGVGGRRVMLQGQIENVRLALANLVYQSPDGYFGEDELFSTMVSEPLRKTRRTRLNVIANCGNQTCGTATRFDLGTFNASTGAFTVHKYLTTTSVCSTEYPTTYYGYCGRAYRYDQADGQRNRANARKCALAGNPRLQAVQSHHPSYRPNLNGVADFPYILFSPKARNQRPDTITVFVHEQLPLNTRDRYTLFFNFDSFDSTSGDVEFTLNNIEQGRNLDNRSDPFTLIDDPGEFTPRIIGANGVLTGTPRWQLPYDGLIVPLKLPQSAQIDPLKNLFELKDYWQDPDGDNNTNPNLVVNRWTGLDGWNIRSVGPDLKTVFYHKVPFDNNTSAPKTAIQVKIDESQRCSPTPLVQ
jgi:hypothetical protein